MRIPQSIRDFSSLAGAAVVYFATLLPVRINGMLLYDHTSRK